MQCEYSNTVLEESVYKHKCVSSRTESKTNLVQENEEVNKESGQVLKKQIASRSSSFCDLLFFFLEKKECKGKENSHEKVMTERE